MRPVQQGDIGKDKEKAQGRLWRPCAENNLVYRNLGRLKDFARCHVLDKHDNQ